MVRIHLPIHGSDSLLQSTLSPCLDPLKQAKKAAQEARRHSTNPVDAASPQLKERAHTDASGNKEGVGMVDQVGSQSATANKLRDWPAK